MAGPDCCVCLEPLSSEENTSLPCTHTFHSSCVRTWLRQIPVCPLCRLPVTRDGSATAPPSDAENNPGLSALWQFIAESTLNVLSHRLRHARVGSTDNDTVAITFSSNDFLMNLPQIIVETLMLASSQNNASPRSIEARFALTASPGVSPRPSSDNSRNERSTSDRLSHEEGQRIRERNGPSEDRESNDGRYFLSFWEVFEETGRVVLVERFGLATRLNPVSEAPQRQPAPSTPQMDITDQRPSSLEDPTPLPEQPPLPSTSTMPETETDEDPPTAAAPGASSAARTSVDHSDRSSVVSARRRFAAKNMLRRNRHRQVSEHVLPQDTPRNRIASDGRSFATFRRWLRETMSRRPGASQPENPEG